MKLFIKQKVFSWKDSFTVKDENGDDRYFVEGELFSLGHRLHIYDAGRNEVATIQQKLLSFMPRYYIFEGGTQVAELIRKFTMFKQRYWVEGPSWILEGDFWSHDYRLEGNNGEVLMTINKEWLTWGDSYALDINDGISDILCLCVVLAVDCANDSDRNNGNVAFFNN